MLSENTFDVAIESLKDYLRLICPALLFAGAIYQHSLIEDEINSVETTDTLKKYVTSSENAYLYVESTLNEGKNI
jgi:hypothetical protein